MPDDRFLHPKLGHSVKVGGLTDFQYRVWTTYLIASDDCGVMRASPLTLQEANESLEQRPHKAVQVALDTLLECGLLDCFEHQGRRYVYQKDWQDWQKVRYPRASLNPELPLEAFAKCSEATQKLFRVRSAKPREDFGKIPETLPESSGSISETFPSPAGAGGRERLTANGKRLTANAEKEAQPRKEAPSFKGQRLTVWQWQFNEWRQIVGPSFDVFAWIQQKDLELERTSQVVPKRSHDWLTALIQAAATKSGIPMAGADTVDDRADKMRAEIARQEAMSTKPLSC